MTNDKRRHAALMCFENREYAHAAMQILRDLGYGFIEHPELIDPVYENTVFLEASKPVPAGADERTEADAAFQEVASAMGTSAVRACHICGQPGVAFEYAGDRWVWHCSGHTP